MHCIKKLLIKVTTFLIMTNDFYWKFYSTYNFIFLIHNKILFECMYQDFNNL